MVLKETISNFELRKGVSFLLMLTTGTFLSLSADNLRSAFFWREIKRQLHQRVVRCAYTTKLTQPRWRRQRERQKINTGFYYKNNQDKNAYFTWHSFSGTSLCSHCMTTTWNRMWRFVEYPNTKRRFLFLNLGAVLPPLSLLLRKFPAVAP